MSLQIPLPTASDGYELVVEDMGVRYSFGFRFGKPPKRGEYVEFWHRGRPCEVKITDQETVHNSMGKMIRVLADSNSERAVPIPVYYPNLLPAL